jgi:cyclopropane fatty-acyl-phospholipid synthase-like methyltransferase
MKNIVDNSSYNERLFGKGLRGRFHLVRFKWLRQNLLQLKCEYHSVLELGCFDGKTIDFLPHLPARYIGFDANWENGLDIAKQKWHKFPQFLFIKCQTPEEMQLNEQFDIAIAMETFEHLPSEIVDGYLNEIAAHTQQYFFATMPNEKGIIFLAKWLVKRIFSKDYQSYTFKELLYATLGKMNKVSRREHKGFDYLSMSKQIGKYFDNLHMVGLPFDFLPLCLCLEIGIIAVKKPNTITNIPR